MNKRVYAPQQPIGEAPTSPLTVAAQETQDPPREFAEGSLVIAALRIVNNAANIMAGFLEGTDDVFFGPRRGAFGYSDERYLY